MRLEGLVPEHIYESQQAGREKERESAVPTEAARLSGPCVSFQDLITGEKNRVRGGARG